MRQMPNNEIAERAVIGCLILNNQTIGKTKKKLSVTDFYYQKYAYIYGGILKLNDKKENADAITLGNLLDSKKIGGAIVFSSLTNDIPDSYRFDEYVNIVRDLSAKRKALIELQSCAESVHKTDDLEKELVKTRSNLGGILSGISRLDSAVPIRQSIQETYKDIIEPPEKPDSISTGMYKIDYITNGLPSGLLTVLAGRPGAGKSAMSMNIAANAALDRKSVLFFSFEDTTKYFNRRMMSIVSEVELTKIATGNLNQDEHSKILGAFNSISSLELATVDRRRTTPSEICTISENYKDRNGLDLVVVDHLGFIHSEGKGLFEKTTNAVIGMAETAKELDVPVLLLSQLNRAVESREDKAPILADLRQTGAIEEYARVVMLLYRRGYYAPKEESIKHELGVNIAKNSHGRTNNCEIWCDLPRMYIGDEPNTSGGKYEY